ncbi:MAG: hypothetical protein R2705_15335 [Ilumatobacteraceae bacterium]
MAVIRHELEIALDADEIEEFRRVAERGTEEDLRMQRLVDDLLFIARHDHGSSETPAATWLVDLDDLVVEEVRRAGRCPVDLVSVSAGQVRGNPDHLGRAISNLLDNAARHAVSRLPSTYARKA